MSSADGAERGQKPKANDVGPGFARVEVKPRVANRRSMTTKKCGKMDSEGAWTEARASDGAAGPRDQPESERKRPGHAPNAQLDNETGVNRMRRNYKCLIYP